MATIHSRPLLRARLCRADADDGEVLRRVKASFAAAHRFAALTRLPRFRDPQLSDRQRPNRHGPTFVSRRFVRLGPHVDATRKGVTASYESSCCPSIPASPDRCRGSLTGLACQQVGIPAGCPCTIPDASPTAAQVRRETLGHPNTAGRAGARSSGHTPRGSDPTPDGAVGSLPRGPEVLHR